MLKYCVQFVVGLLRFVNVFFKPMKLKEKVAIISRQSDEPTLDIQLLCNELRKRKVEHVVLTKTLKGSISGMVAYGFHMVSQMYHLATSKVVVVDGYCILLSVLPKRENQQVIQMWHALGAIKKFGWQNTENPDGHGSQFSEIMQMHRNYDYVVAPSKITGEFFAEGFRTDKEKVVYFGLPRIDFICNKDEEKQREIESVYPKIKGKELVLYVPTFRKNATLELDLFVKEFDFARFNLVIKKHFLDKGDYSWAEQAGAIVDLKYSSMEWLRICDKVITDYSAMAFEAAVADKEIYIFQPDANEYEENVGLNVELEREEIGEYVCKSEVQLFEKLSEPYKKEKMVSFRDKYIEVKLDDCTAELCDFIQKLLLK